MIMVKTDDLKEVINQIYAENSDKGVVKRETGLLIIKGLLYMMGDGNRSYCMLVEEEDLMRRLKALRMAKGVKVI
jgi:hypothetical protein